MSKPLYVCAACAQSFTRKYNARRHNYNIHGNNAELVSYLEYMAGRYSGRYSAIHPSWFRKTPNKPWLTSYGNGARSISSGRQQQGDLYYNPETVDRQSTHQGTQLGQGNSELDELARLLNKYAPDKALKALQWAKIRLQQGDREYLNDMLQILRSLEPRGWRPI